MKPALGYIGRSAGFEAANLANNLDGNHLGQRDAAGNRKKLRWSRAS